MAIQTIIFITLALIAALGFSFFQYLFKKNERNKKGYFFFGLRCLSVFIVLLLLINPKITSTDVEVEKPELLLLADNSESIGYLGEEENVKRLFENLVSNKKIQEKFNVNRLNFGTQLISSDSLDFSATQSDLYSALSEAEELYSNKKTAIVLLTDGNQSLGRDYRYFKKKSRTEILPVVVGDTTSYKDLSIERINVNRYAFLKNRFPVEVFINYSGNEDVNANLKITAGSTIVFSKQLSFSKNIPSQIVNTELPATSLGVNTYKVEIEPISDEKNIINNTQNFAIEVIDERTSVLILTDIAHPDLGAIQKAIESNQQRSVDIKYLGQDNYKISEYQLVIIYQLNRRFNELISEIIAGKYNYLVITGTKTDWNYLNSLDLGYQRNSTNQPQDIFPVYNPTFTSFQFEDIGFNDFPPLVDKFGPLKFKDEKFSVLLSQEIQGVKTGEPLLAVSQSSPKTGILIGENIWRWRAKSYLDNKSFQAFDEFFGKLAQNLASKSSRQRLTVETENFFYANQNAIVSAQYFDENYQFDAGANLKIKLKNKETEKEINSDLILNNNMYEFNGGNLAPGEYSYIVSVEDKNLRNSGEFEIINYNTEQQFVSANLSGMQSFAENNESNLYFPENLNTVVNTLLANDKFKPVLKSQQKAVPLIDWYYLLFILIFILAAEWFYRKYLGLI